MRERRVDLMRELARLYVEACLCVFSGNVAVGDWIVGGVENFYYYINWERVKVYKGEVDDGV